MKKLIWGGGNSPKIVIPFGENEFWWRVLIHGPKEELLRVEVSPSWLNKVESESESKTASLLVDRGLHFMLFLS